MQISTMSDVASGSFVYGLRSEPKRGQSGQLTSTSDWLFTMPSTTRQLLQPSGDTIIPAKAFGTPHFSDYVAGMGRNAELHQHL